MIVAAVVIDGGKAGDARCWATDGAAFVAIVAAQVDDHRIHGSAASPGVPIIARRIEHGSDGVHVVAIGARATDHDPAEAIDHFGSEDRAIELAGERFRNRRRFLGGPVDAARQFRVEVREQRRNGGPSRCRARADQRQVPLEFRAVEHDRLGAALGEPDRALAKLGPIAHEPLEHRVEQGHSMNARAVGEEIQGEDRSLRVGHGQRALTGRWFEALAECPGRGHGKALHRRQA